MAEYNVYVIDLNPVVLKLKKFTKKNPDYKEGKPCVYVGQTAKSPEERFAQHKKGGKLANNFSYKYGRRLRPRNYERHNPLKSRAAAEKKEEWLAEKLRSKGYGVWWG